MDNSNEETSKKISTALPVPPSIIYPSTSPTTLSQPLPDSLPVVSSLCQNPSVTFPSFLYNAAGNDPKIRHYCKNLLQCSNQCQTSVQSAFHTTGNRVLNGQPKCSNCLLDTQYANQRAALVPFSSSVDLWRQSTRSFDKWWPGNDVRFFPY